MNVQPNNYLTIQGWMLTDLHLKGSDLILYALIYGFTQDGESEFSGSITYMQQWAGITRQSVLNVLERLQAAGLIEKQKTTVNGIAVCRYRTTDGGSQKIRPVVKNFDGGSVKITPNNNSDNININNNTITGAKGFDFRSELLAAGVTAEVADAWLQVRKNKRATNSKIALDAVLKEIAKAGMTPDDGIKMAVVNSWQGFKADWVAVTRQTSARPAAPAPAPAKSKFQRMIETGRRLGIITDQPQTPVYDEQ